MSSERKLNKEEWLKFDGKRAVIRKFTQVINNDLVDFFVVKIGGFMFSDNRGENMWATKRDAEKAREQIKNRVRKIINELKNE